MKLWLVIMSYDQSTIVEAEDFYDLHNQIDSDSVIAAIPLTEDVIDKIVKFKLKDGA